MLEIVRARIHQGYRTMKYPDGPAPELPERFAGMPELVAGKCDGKCGEKCADVCPTGAVIAEKKGSVRALRMDLGKCLFCRACQDACGRGAIYFGRERRLASSTREDLVIGAGSLESIRVRANSRAGMFKRSLKLRQVSAGGCNACEADTNVLGTVAWDLGRFGIQFVASPRHADGLLVTGPVAKNMKEALLKTYEAVASPKIVIAAGACAISGGPYMDHYEACNGVGGVLPIDLFIPGCPPHPLTILDGLLDFLNSSV